MKIVEKSVTEIKPYEKNPRKNDEAVQYVKNSIEKFGFRVPIVIDKGGIIVAGHTRLKAAIELGMKKVPCIVADDLTEEQVRAFRIADNKTGERADWDNELLGAELESLMEQFDMTDFGFGEFEITMLTNDFTPEPYDDEMIKQYSQNEQEYLMKKRVIITYSDENEGDVLKLMGLERFDKVVYDITEL